jgi:hypothetical protein
MAIPSRAIVEVEMVFQCRKQFQAGGEVAGIDQLVSAFAMGDVGSFGVRYER